MLPLLVSIFPLAMLIAGNQAKPIDLSLFLGTWKLSVVEPGKLPQPARLSVTFEALASDRMKVNYDQVYGDSHSLGHYEVGFDGHNYVANGFPIFGPFEVDPISGSPKAQRFVAVLWINDRTLLWTLKIYDFDTDVESTFTVRTTVSEDGKTMTAIGTDGSVQLFDRQ